MDDIKGPVPKSAPSAGPPPTTPSENEVQPTPDVPPQAPMVPEEKKKGGMKAWLVILLVVLALVVGGAGVYFWQQSSSTTDETAALQAQIDQQAQDLEDAKKAAADQTADEKDKQIETLTTDNKTLTDENVALQKELDTWVLKCGDGPAPADCTKTP